MPLEIRELVIKTSIQEGEGKQAPASQPAAAGSGGTSDQDGLIAACVEQVLAILKERAER